MIKLKKILCIIAFTIMFSLSCESANAQPLTNTGLKGTHYYNGWRPNANSMIGLPLEEPELGWTRYDDQNNKILINGEIIDHIKGTQYYLSGYSALDLKKYSKYENTIKFSFEGDGFRIISKVASSNNPDKFNCEDNYINVYLDNEFIGSYNELQKYTNVADSRVILEDKTCKSGKHTVKLVQGTPFTTFSLDAVDIKNGELIESNKEPKMWIESPSNSSTIHDEILDIGGWALNDSGINHINIYLDDKYIDKTTVKYPRTDVTNTFKNYKKSENAGFSYKYSANKLSSGSHKVKVTVVGNDGSEQSQERYFKINRKEPKLWIESPNNGQKVKNKIEIAGWTLNDSGVDYLNLYIDGKFIGKTTAKYERYDVVNTFKDYIDGIHSGFSYNYDVSKLTKGSHVLKVTSVGNDGSTISQERRFIIDRNESKMWIESPNSDEKVTNKLRVGGWALNDSGIKNINVYVDNQFIGSPTAKYDRTDIANAFPSYSNPLKSGFLYDLNLSKYSNGKHIIKVIVIGNDGTEQAQSRTIYK